jgi:hypothetical protein
MATIPKTATPLHETLQRLLELAQPVQHNDKIDASLIGHPCDRAIIYAYRHATEPAPQHIHPERALVLALLAEAGLVVTPAVPRWPAFLQGHVDGIVHGVPDAAKTPHLLIIDIVHSLDIVAAKQAGAVEKSNPELYCRAQVSMKACGVDRCLYVAYGRHDRNLYTDRIRYVAADAAALVERAAYLAGTLELSDRIDNKAVCGSCIHAELCRGTVAPRPAMPMTLSCRSCVHADIKAERWHCWKHDKPAAQPCEDHELFPNWVWFAQHDGERYTSNGNQWTQTGEHGYRTIELTQLPAALVGAGTVDAVKQAFDATVEDVQ